MPLYGDIYPTNFFDQKKSRNRQFNGDFDPLRDYGISSVWLYHPLIYLNLTQKMIKQWRDH